MSDDYDSGDTEKRRASVFLVVDAALDSTERWTEQHCSDHSQSARRQLLTKQAESKLTNSLGKLDYYVSDKTVANDYVHQSARNILPLDVPGKIHVRGTKKHVGFLD